MAELEGKEGMGRVDRGQQSKRREAERASLREEIRTLRASLRGAVADMESGEGDRAKMGTLVARLSDSIGRALLAEQRLAADSDKAARLRGEVERILREVGLGEE